MKRYFSVLMVATLLILFLPNLLHTDSVEAAKAIPDPIKIVIDPGHGGKDPGAIGVNGLKEKDANLDMALRLRDILLKAGYQVVMTRETDKLLVDYKGSSQKYLDLQARADVATREKADLFVSIHCNYYGPTTQGTLVLYYDVRNQSSLYPATDMMKKWTNESKALASHVLNAITAQMGTKSLGIQPSNVYVVRSGTVPSILVETAFLSNREEAEKLASPAYRQRMAEAIAMGIMKYLPPRYIDIRDHWAKTEIVTLSYMGIIKGYQDRLFRPEQNLSRAELISLLDRVIGFEDLLKLDRNESQENPENEVHFSDLSEEYWAYNEIRNAAKLGIIVGYPDGTFKPNKGLSREEMAAILYRALTLEEKDSVDGDSENSLPAGEMNNPADSNDENQTVKNSANQTTEGTEQLEQPDPSGNPADAQQEQKEESASVQSMDYEIPFIDVPPDHWSVIAIRSLTSNGIIKGVTDNLFGFGKNVSRAEAAALLYRIITQQEKQPAMVGSNQ